MLKTISGSCKGNEFKFKFDLNKVLTLVAVTIKASYLKCLNADVQLDTKAFYELPADIFGIEFIDNEHFTVNNTGMWVLNTYLDISKSNIACDFSWVVECKGVLSEAKSVTFNINTFELTGY